MDAVLLSSDMPYVFRWRNNPKRAQLYGRRCRIVVRCSNRRSVVVEFEDGQWEARVEIARHEVEVM